MRVHLPLPLTSGVQPRGPLVGRPVPRVGSPRMLTVYTTGWEGPGLVQSIFDGQTGIDLSYWDLHGFLLIPTLWLLTAGKPTLLSASSRDPLAQLASYSFLAFILTIAVAQAFVWDSVGAQIGIWEVSSSCLHVAPMRVRCAETGRFPCAHRLPPVLFRLGPRQFNPAKTTGLGESTLLPLEEVLWLFHHVVKAALWQLKMNEWQLTAAPDGTPSPLPTSVRTVGNGLLFALWVGGVATLLGDVDSAKCLGLIAAFFAPVFGIIFNLGNRYLRSHWRLFVSGWLPPGAWTVAIDCVGQQQQVWNFPSQYLTGINTLPDGLLKLDIAAVYLVSTFAVTATGAIILAASDEFAAIRGLATSRDEARVEAASTSASSAATTAMASASNGADPQAEREAEPEAEAERGSVGTATGTEPTQVAQTPSSSSGESLWDLGLFIFHGAAPALAERAAMLLPPASDAWRSADKSRALQPQGGAG